MARQAMRTDATVHLPEGGQRTKEEPAGNGLFQHMPKLLQGARDSDLNGILAQTPAVFCLSLTQYTCI